MSYVHWLACFSRAPESGYGYALHTFSYIKICQHCQQSFSDFLQRKQLITFNCDQFHNTKSFTLTTQNVCPAVAYLTLILAIFEYELLLLKVVCLAQNVPEFTSEHSKLKGSMPLDPLVWVGFTVYPCHFMSAPPIPKQHFTPLYRMVQS